MRLADSTSWLVAAGVVAVVVIVVVVWRRGAPPRGSVILCELGRDNHQHVVGHDGAYSVELPDKTRFWAFGDTWIGNIDSKRRTIERSLPSSGALQRSESICGPLEYLTDDGGEPRQLLPGLDGDPAVAHWPLAMAASGDRVHLYYQRVRKLDRDLAPGGGELNFDVLGVGVASASVADLRFTLDAGGALLFDAAEHGFADAVIVRDGFLYGLGCRPVPKSLERPCRLARVPVERIAERAAYTFWTGHAWSDRIVDAAVLFDSGGAEMTLTVDKDRFLLTYLEPFSCDIRLRSATELTGPWSRSRSLYRARVPRDGFCYGAKLHTQDPARGWAEVTWNTNGPLSAHVSDPHLYWPQAVRVRLK